MEYYEDSGNLMQGWSTNVGNRVISKKAIIIVCSLCFSVFSVILLLVFYHYRSSLKLLLESSTETVGICALFMLLLFGGLYSAAEKMCRTTVKYIIHNGCIKSESNLSWLDKFGNRSTLELDNIMVLNCIKRIVSMPSKRCIVLYDGYKMVVFTPDGRHNEAVDALTCLAPQAELEVDDTDSIFL